MLKIQVTKELTDSEFKQNSGWWKEFDLLEFGEISKDYDGLEEAPTFIVAREDDELAGVLYVVFEFGVARIKEIMVNPNYRNKGIGKQLLDKVEEIASEYKCHKLWLETTETGNSIRLYKRCGYEIEARLKKHFFQADFVIMSKWLDYKR
ncbi:MAG: GNAT family N-acetyltransferase [Patescibacteria group bacterium]